MLSSARFTRNDFRAYLRWFADPELNRRLGPLDAAWLEHVLADATGVQLSFFLAGALVAVAGIALPPTPDLPYGITDLAVHPGRRRQGIGRQVIAHICAAEAFAAATEWQACVDPDNVASQGLLAGLGWVRAPAAEGDIMLIYRCRVAPAAPVVMPRALTRAGRDAAHRAHRRPRLHGAAQHQAARAAACPARAAPSAADALSGGRSSHMRRCG